jgi:hypothetical protein
MLGIGAISYSLYLCHWPIIFFARFIFGDTAEGAAATLAQAALMVAVAAAMYHLVERRFILPSQAEAPSFRKNAAAFALAVVPLAALTHATFLSKGFSWRLPSEQFELAHLQGFPAGSDLGGLHGPVGVQFVGDSLGLQYEYGLLPAMKALNISFEALGGAGCPILYGASLSKSTRRSECNEARDRSLARLADTNLPIILTQYWKMYDDASIDYERDGVRSASSSPGSYTKLRAALAITIEDLVRRGHRILLVGTQVDPGCPVNVPRLIQGPLRHAPLSCPPTSLDQARRMVAPTDQILAEMQAKWPSAVSMFRPIDYFCEADCPVVKDGLWLYNNTIHLSLAGANLMMTRSEPVFRNFLQNGK